MNAHYRFVIRAYPAAYRQSYSDELVETANELSPRGWSLRQSRSLLFEGLRTRARLAANGSPSQLWASAIAVALGATFLIQAGFPLIHLLGGGDDAISIIWPISPWAFLLPQLACLAALTLSTRWPTALTITAANATLAIGSEAGALALASVLVSSSIAWWLALRTEGRRAFSPVVGIIALATTVLLALALGPQAFAAAAALLRFGSLLLGLALVRVDPRPLILATTLALLSTSTLFASLLRPSGGEYLSPEAWIVPLISMSALATMTLLSRYGTRQLFAT